MRLSDFLLDRAIVEIRYPPALLHWDRAGRLWSTMKGKWPELRLHQAQPSQTIFTLASPRREAVVELEQARIIEFKTDKALPSFIEAVYDFFDVVLVTLEIDTIERIGFRQIFLHKTQDASTAAGLVADTGVLRLPPGSPFGITGKLLGPEYVVRWEGDTLGVRAALKAETRTLDYNPPPSTPELDAFRRETHGVVCDVDLFTTQPITVDQLNVREWLQQAALTVHRDAESLLGGWR